MERTRVFRPQLTSSTPHAFVGPNGAVEFAKPTQAHTSLAIASVVLGRLKRRRQFVGSIEEAAAETMFDIVLVPASSAAHDAIAGDGRRVEIEATYGSSGVAVRQTSTEPL